MPCFCLWHFEGATEVVGQTIAWQALDLYCPYLFVEILGSAFLMK